jgi:transcriptional regulator with XRE-family HTH domain/uncharacterized cupin superfamily protein
MRLELRVLDADLSTGARLRAGRRDKGLTLRQLATRVGVSAQLLSQIENGKTQPSVPTLKLVVAELGLSMDDVISGPSPAGRRPVSPALRAPQKTGEAEGPVFRADSFPQLRMSGGVILSQLPAALLGDGIETFVTMMLPPGMASTTDGSFVRHDGTEVCFVYEGVLTLKLGFESADLETGDIAAFQSSFPHVYVNNGDVPARGLWLQTEPLAYPPGCGDLPERGATARSSRTKARLREPEEWQCRTVGDVREGDLDGHSDP